MAFKSVLKPEDSIVAGVAVAALVVGVYQGGLGSVAQAQATPANHPIMQNSLTKAGYTSVILVAGLGLLARDPNIVILGGAVVIAEELHYRHAIQTDHETGMPAQQGPAAYTPVENVSPQPNYGGEPYMTSSDEIG